MRRTLFLMALPLQQESKKLKPSVSSSNEFGDCIFIDVEENKASIDHPVPMFLEETETWLSEADEMVSNFIFSPSFELLELMSSLSAIPLNWVW